MCKQWCTCDSKADGHWATVSRFQFRRQWHIWYYLIPAAFTKPGQLFVIVDLLSIFGCTHIQPGNKTIEVFHIKHNIIYELTHDCNASQLWFGISKRCYLPNPNSHMCVSIMMEIYQGINQKKFNDQISDITLFQSTSDITQCISGWKYIWYYSQRWW